MVIYILIFLIILFHLSYEINELRRFGSIPFYSFNDVYLDTSIYKKAI